MEFYLLRSAACLGAFLLFYKLFLEKENMHTFKRFYLLGALFLSFAIPLITFTSYTVISENINPNLLPNTIVEGNESLISLLELLPSILGILYVTGVAVFGLRFAKNLITILLKIKRNKKLKLSSYIHVLLHDKVLPHTFFKYIFLNKSKYEAQEIPPEVMLHEQTHAQQKHSIDILFIEILQILFWFNPLIYLIKHSIKLNHEFLADEAVLSKGIESNYYQNILLVFSSNTQTPILANSINYSLIKKRFTVMKTHTSKRKIWIRSLLLFPLVALLLFSFSAKEEIERFDEAPIDYTLQDGATKTQVKEYNKLAKKYNEMDESSMKIKSSDIERLKYLYNLMSNKQRKSSQPFPNFPPPPPAVEKAPKPMKVAKGVNDHLANVPPPPKAPKSVKVVKGVNDTDANIPPPPPKAPKETKNKKEKTKIKEEKVKVKKEEEKLVVQRVKLEKRNQEREVERLVLVEKRKVNHDKMRTLQHKEMETQRVAMRTETNKVRLEKREVIQKKRQLEKEQRKNDVNKRQVEQRKRSLEDKNKEKIKKENI